MVLNFILKTDQKTRLDFDRLQDFLNMIEKSLLFSRTIYNNTLKIVAMRPFVVPSTEKIKKYKCSNLENIILRFVNFYPKKISCCECTDEKYQESLYELINRSKHWSSKNNLRFSNRFFYSKIELDDVLLTSENLKDNSEA